MLTVTRVFTWIMTLFVTTIWIYTWTYDGRTRLVPLLISSVTLCMVLVNLYMEQRTSHQPEEEDMEKAGNTRQFLLILGWLVALFLSIMFVGFLISLPVFVIYFLRSYRPKPWGTTLLSTVVAWVAIYGMFEVLMGMKLFRGLLFGGILM